MGIPHEVRRADLVEDGRALCPDRDRSSSPDLVRRGHLARAGLLFGFELFHRTFQVACIVC